MDNRFMAVASPGSQISKFMNTAEEAVEWGKKHLNNNAQIGSVVIMKATATVEREVVPVIVKQLPEHSQEIPQAAAKPPLFKNGGGEANHDNL